MKNKEVTIFWMQWARSSSWSGLGVKNLSQPSVCLMETIKLPPNLNINSLSVLDSGPESFPAPHSLPRALCMETENTETLVYLP